MNNKAVGQSDYQVKQAADPAVAAFVAKLISRLSRFGTGAKAGLRSFMAPSADISKALTPNWGRAGRVGYDVGRMSPLAGLGGLLGGTIGLSAVNSMKDKKGSADVAYAQGFVDKCAAAGIDADTLLKISQASPGLMQSISTKGLTPAIKPAVSASAVARPAARGTKQVGTGSK